MVSVLTFDCNLVLPFASNLLAGSRESGAAAVSDKLHRNWWCCDVYTSNTVVCAAQMGINFRQSSSTVPLLADTACTIFPNRTGAMTNQSIDYIYLRKVSSSGIR